MTHDEMIAVLQAKKNGVATEYKPKGTTCEWRPSVGLCDFINYDYRVATTPREIWVNEFPETLGGSAFKTKDEADASAGGHRIRCIRFREVIE